MKKQVKKTVARKPAQRKPVAKKPAQRKSAPKAKRPYVYYDTISKSVRGGFSNPGERRICNVGKHKVLVERADRLNRYGNPVHTATVIDKNGRLGASYRSSGNAALVVSEALKRNGVDTKRRSKR